MEIRKNLVSMVAGDFLEDKIIGADESCFASGPPASGNRRLIRVSPDGGRPHGSSASLQGFRSARDIVAPCRGGWIRPTPHRAPGKAAFLSSQRVFPCIPQRTHDNRNTSRPPTCDRRGRDGPEVISSPTTAVVKRRQMRRPGRVRCLCNAPR